MDKIVFVILNIEVFNILEVIIENVKGVSLFRYFERVMI